MDTITEWPEISDDPEVQSRYVAMRECGESHSISEMLAFQQAPIPKDDTVWLKSMRPREQFANAPEIVQKAYTEEALAAGHNISGAVYVPGLARRPGDPEAWVHGLGDVKKRLEERGWGSEGDVNVKARNDEEPTPEVDVADDIVEQKVLEMMYQNPDLQETPELYEEAKDIIAPHWTK
jgi:hypothetical protein